MNAFIILHIYGQADLDIPNVFDNNIEYYKCYLTDTIWIFVCKYFPEQ